MRDTKYARELVSAALDYQTGDQARIERLYVKDEQQEEIRFSWWRDSRMMLRPLDLPEDDLVALFRAAIQERVFSREFLRKLKSILPGD